MKKLIFIFAVSAVGMILAMPSGARAQSITNNFPDNKSEKLVNPPLQLTPCQDKHPDYVINPTINFNETRLMPNGGPQLWNGQLKNWPRKKPMRCEM